MQKADATEDRKKSILDRVLPDLLAEGCLVNEHWVPAGCATATAMYNSKPLKIVGVMMSACHPGGFDLVQQAPVLAVAYATDMRKRRAKKDKLHALELITVRRQLIRSIARELDQTPRLRDLLKRYGLAKQLRVIKGAALEAEDLPILRRLSQMEPSTLAQAIPADGFVQTQWLNGLRLWCRFMTRHEVDPLLHIDWCAVRLGQFIADTLERTRVRRQHAEWRAWAVGEIADFVAHATAFNPAWSWARAEEEAGDWHAALASMQKTDRFLAEHKIGFNDLIDYGALPDRMTVDGHDIVALRTGAALHEEGRRMRHCVASYANAVIKGACRIYSVREGDRRLATLEIIHDGNSWRQAQIKARFNDPPLHPVAVAATEFLRRVNAEARR